MKPLQSQRCLVIADAYYDWSLAKKPYLVFLQNKQRPFAFAGLYDRWKDPESGLVTVSFTIITTTANRLLSRAGIRRMPVIIAPGYEKQWLKSSMNLAGVLNLLDAYDPDEMNAYQVSDLVNTPGVNSISMITPVGKKIQREQEEPRPIVRSSPYHRKNEKGSPEGTWGEKRSK